MIAKWLRHWGFRALPWAVLLAVVGLLATGGPRWPGQARRDIRGAALILQQVQALNRLQTARQRSQQVVTATSTSPWLGEYLSRDEITFVAVTQTTAGVDLARLEPGDLALHGNELAVRLPPAQIFDVAIDEAASQVVSRERGLLRFTPDRTLEAEARREATRQARAAALHQGILEQAQDQAEAAFRELLAPLGFTEVRFVRAQG